MIRRSATILPIMIFSFLLMSCSPQVTSSVSPVERMGDWEGFRIDKNGQHIPMSAQLIANGNNRYTANLLNEFDCEDNFLAVITGKSKGDDIQLIGSYKYGTRWKGGH